MRVLDLTRLLPGPWATLQLVDFGADVVKVEDPDPGDYMRALSPGMFAALNRGKRSVVVDLKKPAGRAAFEKLCATADVLVESFRPGVLERLGLGDLCERFPRLVLCRLSGFGQSAGPWRDRAGHDIGYIALAGVLARCRGQLPGVQLADLFGGAQSIVVAVLAALLERERTGRGQVLDVSMTDGSLGLVLPYLGGDTLDVLLGEHPCYRVYACKGGGYMALGALEPKFWERFCQAVERLGWVDRQLDRVLTPAVDELFLRRSRDEWDALLRPFDCCSEAVLELSELRDHPLLRERDLFLPGGLPRTVPALVPTGSLPSSEAPTLGQHDAELLG
jgi:crotonobetainyl-CoA:carnitine CoA-transferase CaiB-like acyl-CoA transferase